LSLQPEVARYAHCVDSLMTMLGQLVKAGELLLNPKTTPHRSI
jgi:hypothetical protein